MGSEPDEGGHYMSFLIRCWRLRGGARRIQVEHVQTGATARVPTFEAALDWLSSRWPKPEPAEPAPKGETHEVG